MKKIHLILAACAAIAAASCTKEKTAAGIPQGDVAEITVSLSGDALSKAVYNDATAGNEVKVNSLQVLVFNDGVIDAYGNDYKVFPDGNFATKYGVRLTATRGQRKIYAVVNASADLSGVATESELLAKVSYLKNNSIGGFEMIGDTETELVAKNFIDVPVYRFVTRIKIDKITNRFTNTALGDEVYLRRMYVTNLGGDATYSKTPGSIQFATTGFASSLNAVGTTISESEKTALNTMIYEKIFTGTASTANPGNGEGCPKIALNASYTTPHSFYVYPNANLESLPTHLVIEVVVAGRIYTYPLKLSTDSTSTLESNKSYEIKELILTRVGNSSDGDDDIDDGEDKPVEPADADFMVTVQNWDIQLLGDDGEVRI